jgi:hypothetical protein
LQKSLYWLSLALSSFFIVDHFLTTSHLDTEPEPEPEPLSVSNTLFNSEIGVSESDSNNFVKTKMVECAYELLATFNHCARVRVFCSLSETAEVELKCISKADAPAKVDTQLKQYEVVIGPTYSPAPFTENQNGPTSVNEIFDTPSTPEFRRVLLLTSHNPLKTWPI